MFNPDREGGLFHYAFFRTLDTAFGVVIGFLVNRFIAPPNHLKALQLELATIYKLAKEVLTDHKKLPALKKELNTLALIHTNYQADEKYDNHDVSNENLRNMVEACHYLCFHFQHYKDSDTTIKNYHTANIYKTLALLEKTIAELKGAI